MDAVEESRSNVKFQILDKSLDEDSTDEFVKREKEIEEEEKMGVSSTTTTSDDSSGSSSEDERPKFSAILSEGHKFSDGIVWETIEECDEENLSESDEAMNDADMKTDFNESSIVTRGTTLEKKESSPAFITPTTDVIDQDNEASNNATVFKASTVASKQESGINMQFDTFDVQGSNVNRSHQSFSSLKISKSFPKIKEIEDDCSVCQEKKECQVSKEEIGNISVKNLAKFWEQMTKTEELEEKSESCPKKWKSMPNLKERRQLPASPSPIASSRPSTSLTSASTPAGDVIKSDEVIDDVDLCRSVSLRDRRQMFEMMTSQSKMEKSKQWKSMPSLKQERQPSPRNRVHWEDSYNDDQMSSSPAPIIDTELDMRGRSPVRELVKTFQSCESLISNSSPSPLSPLVKTNELQLHEDMSSSDSLSSSLTSSSLSTIISRCSRPASLLEDSSGEIYTESDHQMSSSYKGAFVQENGVEYSLTPLTARKFNFEQKIQSSEFNQTKPKLHEFVKDVKDKIECSERVVSNNVPYIEEEKDILMSINTVQSLKSKFLN